MDKDGKFSSTIYLNPAQIIKFTVGANSTVNVFTTDREVIIISVDDAKNLGLKLG